MAEQLSMITGKPVATKRKLDAMVNAESDRAVPLDPDSDFDDEPKPEKRVIKPSIPAVQKATPRLQACGEKQLDRCVTAARDNGPAVVVVVVSLSLRLTKDAGADLVIKADDNEGAAYDLCPPHEREQDDLGHAEFLGLFFSGTSQPGVGDVIAHHLLNDENVHVVVVEPSKNGFNFARLAACVAALKVGFENRVLGTELFKRVAKPQGAVWKNVINQTKKCRSDLLLRGKARDLYHELP
tara:strand:+ start:972 stop:1691 length:720 start_codon:yes stop_codon:yes gene_type:complete